MGELNGNLKTTSVAAECRENGNGPALIPVRGRNVRTVCDGSWMLAGNLYDTPEDDFPNNPRMVENGYAKISSGRFTSRVSHVRAHALTNKQPSAP